VLEPLLKRAFMFLADGNWKSADEYCEKVLDLDPENGEAYLGKLMADVKVSRRELLANCDSFDKNPNYSKILKYGNDDLKDFIQGQLALVEENRLAKPFDKEIEKTYKIKEDGTVAITAMPVSLWKETNIILPSMIEGRVVSEIAPNAFSFNSHLQTVKIPEGVVDIGNGAFGGSSIVSVSLPSTVKRIGVRAFNGCKNLTSIIIPEGVATVEAFAFSGCKALASVTLPNTLTSIGKFCFNQCSIQSITIPSSVTQIEQGAFGQCYSLKSITVQDGNSSYTSIQGHLYSKDTTVLISFSPCGLSTFEIPDHVKKIAPFAIYGAELESIQIPSNGLEEIEESGVGLCKKLRTIEVDKDNCCFKSIEGILYSKDGAQIIKYPAGECEKHFTIPNCVKNIGAGAFDFCENLESLVISEGTEKIGERAFFGCSNLTSVALPGTITEIEDKAFSGCINLQNIVIPGGVTCVNDEVFRNCQNLTAVFLPDNLLRIGALAFSGCQSLQSVSIPASVVSIGSSAFSGCVNLQSISIPASVISIGRWAFAGCENLDSISLPVGITQVEEYTFLNCKKLTGVLLPEGMTDIGRSAFKSCESLEMITLPKSIARIGDSAFSSCKALKEITIPENVVTLGTWVFSHCNELKTVQIHSTIADIGKYVFSDCDKISTLYLTDREEAKRYGFDLHSKKLPKIITFKEKEEAEQQKERQRLREEEEKERQLEAKKKQEELQRSRRTQGICQYCGGTFKGLFSKTCTSCGKKKDY